MPEKNPIDELNAVYDQFIKFPGPEPLPPELKALLKAMKDAINNLDERTPGGFLDNPDVLGTKDILK
ncbi:hypothetical protein [Bradyrhizobium sp. CCGUVB23]|uniref:hypothetical protein n=1 Tax=Bradyrhizobium sp. CCGUVB23 TaxID=2949630 RepID=UPI0020B338E7|nr:hypothetical protein [Bradyrhizobium sp. CCGUVB23]MCP3468517.1 hypothetical protein [Bradyrhizobium sp. CCGUVB23]